MNFRPLVSIVIPVYNGANFMRKAIDSALAQTYDNLEILVINDGSKDNGATERIALEYGDKIRYFRKDNGGVASALNLGIEKMRGDYFSWLSHDDLYAPHKVETQIRQLQDLDKLTICYSSYKIFSQETKWSYDYLFHEEFSYNQLRKPLFPLFHGLFYGCTLLIHKLHFFEVGNFNTELFTTQDYDLWFRILKRPQVKIAYNGAPLVTVRLHGEQTSKKYPATIAECNQLWLGMMKGLTMEQRISIGGSPYSFYKQLNGILENTKYDMARDESRRLLALEEENLQSYIAGLKVTVVIVFESDLDALHESLESVLRQTHKNFEILLINNGSSEDPGSLCQQEPRTRSLNLEKQSTLKSWKSGLVEATGDYIALLQSGDTFAPEKLHRQLEFMVRQGFRVSQTSYRFKSHPGVVIHAGKLSGNVFREYLTDCPARTSTVMLGREIVTEHLFNLIDSYDDEPFVWIGLAYENSFGGLDLSLSDLDCSQLASSELNSEPFLYTRLLQHCMQEYGLEKTHKQCLILASRIIEHINRDFTFQSPPRGSLLQRTFKYLKIHGFKATLKKILTRTLPIERTTC